MSGLPPTTPLQIKFEDKRFINDCMAIIPRNYHAKLIERYELVYPFSRREANLLFTHAKDRQINLVEHMDAVSFPFYPIPTASEDMGGFHSLACKNLIDNQSYQDAVNYCESQGITPPVINNAAVFATDTNSLASAIKRVTDGKWWDRKLAVKRAREAELRRIKAKLIGKNKQVYCSDICTERFIRKQESAKDYIETMELVSDAGDVVSMADVLKGSISNPEIRRAELMVRMYGFDQYASEHGDRAEFYTLTAPSKYHSNSRKYNGSSPKAVQAYLVKVWSKIRAKLKRNNLEIYGLRVVEPHADSCPHWHMMLFMQDGTQEAIRSIMREYALKEDGTERGAKQARFQYESIKAGAGYATAYLSKYIAKNIDGHNVGIDHETGELSADTSTRVRAWASRWGIRQFQQIGGAPVGVWRELRKLEGADNDLIEQARIAADNADWKTYLELQGGALTKRKNQLIKTFSETCIDTDTGEIKTSGYGELIKKVKGLEVDTGRVTTRFINWTLQSKNIAIESDQAIEILSENQAERGAWLIGNNCTPPELANGDIDLEALIDEANTEAQEYQTEAFIADWLLSGGTSAPDVRP